MEAFYYDTGPLQALLNSGTYDAARANALRNGIEFRTSWTVIEEMRRRPESNRTAAENAFLSNPESKIGVDVDPADPNRTWKAENWKELREQGVIPDDAGERSAASLARQRIAAGESASVITQNSIDIRKGRLPGGIFDGLPSNSVKAIGKLPNFGPGSSHPNDPQFADVPDATRSIYSGDPIAEAQARDLMRDFQQSKQRNISPETRLATNSEIGVEVYTTARPGNPLEQRYGLPGQSPDSGYISETDAWNMRPDIDDARKSITDTFRQQIDSIFGDAASYGPDGELSPAGLARFKAAAAALYAAGVGLAIWDTYDTSIIAREKVRAGDYQGAAQEVSALGGRLAGGLWGAELGWALGSIGGIYGKVIGALALGLIGTAIGDAAMRNIADWLGSLFGSEPRGPNDDFYANVINTMGDLVRAVRGDPLVLDLDGDGIELVSLASSTVRFDLDGDGLQERVGWVSPQDGLLVHDLNGNGVADDVSELFGSANVDGYDELKLLDSNNDGQITALDTEFVNLKIWRDLNQDGISTNDEMLSLAQAGISRFNLNYTQLDSEVGGNVTARKGSYTRIDNATRDMASVWFGMDESVNRPVIPINANLSDFYSLPNLPAAASMPDLRTAMYFDPVLKAMVEALFTSGFGFESFADFAGLPVTPAFSPVTSLSGPGGSWVLGPAAVSEVTSGRFIEILYRWAGVDISAPANPARPWHVQVFEAVTGIPLELTNNHQRERMEQAWPQLVGQLGTRFLMEAANMPALSSLGDWRATLAALDPSDPDYFEAVVALSEGAMADIDTPPTVSPFLAPFQLLSLDPVSGEVKGDFDAFAHAFTAGAGSVPTAARSMSTAPGAVYGDWFAWYQNHGKFLFNVAESMGISADYVQRVTGWRWMFGSIGEVEGTSGNDILEQASSSAPRVISAMSNGAISVETGVLATRDQALYGYGGDDELRGLDGVDRLVGGVGNDLLKGGSGGDMYVYASGDGFDTIIDESGTDDVIYFSSELRSENLQVSRPTGTNNLFIHFGDPSQGITLTNQWGSSGNSIEQFHFVGQDGLDAGDIATQYLASLPTSGSDVIAGSWASEQIATQGGNDTVTAGDGNDILLGGAGHDSLSGENGNDSITGGLGNDLLNGGYGVDTFYYNLGDGDDVIIDDTWGENEESVKDTLRFGSGITADDLILSGFADDWNSIRIGFIGEAGSIKIMGQNYGWAGIESVVFSDDSHWTLTDLMARYVADQQTVGHDLVHGSHFADSISSGAGDDVVVAGNGNDAIRGGTGHDSLQGGYGADTYVYNSGDGHDVILDEAPDDNEAWVKDTLSFGVGITASDLVFSNYFDDWNSIRISIAGQGSIKITGQNHWAYGIEAINFSDGSTLDLAQIMAGYVSDQQSVGNDLVHGSNYADNIASGAGDDIVIAGHGNDSITGGTGHDSLQGGYGADTYVYNLGDGHDVILDEAPDDNEAWVKDTLSFGVGITASDLVFSNYFDDWNSIRISIAGQGSIKITGQNHWAYGIEAINFADGSTLDLAQIMARYVSDQQSVGNDLVHGSNYADNIASGAGDDIVIAGHGNDSITGGAGHDSLQGGYGADTYVYNLGDGHDIIFDEAWDENEASVKDEIRFGEGIDATDILIEPDRSNNGANMLIRISGQPGSILVPRQWEGGIGIETFRFADGTIWTSVEISAQFALGQARVAAQAINGTASAEILVGSEGDDRIYASNGNDTLMGGTGDDYLRGDSGDDTYVFNLGDGVDTIYEAESEFGWGGTETLRFGLGIALEDLVLSKSTSGWNDLRIGIVGTTDLILINQQDVSYQGRYFNRIENFVFQAQQPGGSIVETVVSWQTLEAKRVAAAKTSGNDAIVGGTAADTIDGGGGNDTLYGWTGNDILIGGTGDDYLRGDSGDDTYMFNLGDGQDTIYEAESEFGWGGAETLRFGLGITLEDLILSKPTADWNDLRIGIAGTTDLILVDQQDASYQGRYYNRIENFVFQTQEPGGSIVETVVSWQTLEARRVAAAKTSGNDIIVGGTAADMIDGGVGNDTLYGWTGNDILVGGAGNDYLRGDSGDDTYMFNLGDGADTIYEAESEFGLGGAETLRFGLGIALEDLIFSKSTSDWNDLRISIAGTTDSILIDQQDASYQGRYYNRIENFVFQTQDTGGSITETTVSWQALEAFRITQAKTSSNNVIIGGTDADSIDGGAGSDTLYGWTGNDLLVGGEGNDILDGGAGTDVALLSGLSPTYSMVASGGTLNVTDNAPTVDGDDGVDRLTTVEKLRFANGEEIGIAAPVILDLDGAGVTTVSASASDARFDMDGDGIADRTSWMGRGEGMLFLDRDGNGTLSNAGEFSFVNDVTGAASDLVGLRAFDSNGDGTLSSEDDRFGDFRIWRDGDGNGAVDQGEILSLTGAEVRSLGLAGSAVNGTVALGDVVTINTGSFTRTDGTSAAFIDAALTYFAGGSQNGTSSIARQQVRPFSRRQLDAFDGDGLRGREHRELQVDWQYERDPITYWPRLGGHRMRSDSAIIAIDDADQLASSPTSVPVSTSGIDRQLAMIVQEMSVFGAQSAGEGLRPWQRENTRPLEFFA